MEPKERQKFAESITTEFMRPVYGFALTRTSTMQDAEDLSQDICVKLFRTLLIKDDIESITKFVWTIAHNTLANYYRKKSKSYIGNIDDLIEVLASNDLQLEDQMIEHDMTEKLQTEIAYLSKVQRKIIILYYYSGKKQSEIAEIIGVPLGTIKWHLSEAKNELKKGFDIMRNTSELKFNPIKFDILGISGSVGTLGGINNFLRSTLSQNIAYAVWKEAKTINEIADCLGVSPIYVESEAEFLEENGFLINQGNKYLANFLIDEPTTELNELKSNMYQTAAKLVANDLFDELMKSELLDSDALTYPDKDKNFLLWSLIFYICAFSGENLMDNKITFEEAATIRPDGGVNIAYVSVVDENVVPPIYYDSLKKTCGPCWNGTENVILWLVDSEWSSHRINIDTYAQYIERDLNLLERFANGEELSKEDYAFMAEKGYIKKNGEKFEFAIVRICEKNMKHKLIEIGDKIKEKYYNNLKLIRDEYVKFMLDLTPKHLQKMQRFTMQYIFYSDGWFMLHCAKELIENGRLKLPTETQQKSLTMIMLPNR